MIVTPCPAADIRLSPDFPELAAEYTAESAMREMPMPNVNWELYQLLEDSGSLHCFAAREDGTLAGFVFVISSISPEYGVLISCTEAFFVGNAWRHTGAGLKLLAAAEAKSRELKSFGLAANGPLGGKLAEVLPKCGYREIGRMFFKRNCDA